MRLLREFRYEQPDPARFYTALALDSAQQLSQYVDLGGRRMLDVGGGPGFFRDAFTDAGATYFALDSDVGELSGRGDRAAAPSSAAGCSCRSRMPPSTSPTPPTCSSTCPSRGGWPRRCCGLPARAGIVFLSYTTWYGPWGGHETAPWHYLGGRRARRRYARTHGKEPKNKYGESLFRVTVARRPAVGPPAGAAATSSPSPLATTLLGAWLLRVPLLREAVTWNLVLVLRKR